MMLLFYAEIGIEDQAISVSLRDRINGIADRVLIILIICGDRDRVARALKRKRDNGGTAAVLDQRRPRSALIERIRKIFDATVAV